MPCDRRYASVACVSWGLAALLGACGASGPAPTEPTSTDVADVVCTGGPETACDNHDPSIIYRCTNSAYRQSTCVAGEGQHTRCETQSDGSGQCVVWDVQCQLTCTPDGMALRQCDDGSIEQPIACGTAFGPQGVCVSGSGCRCFGNSEWCDSAANTLVACDATGGVVARHPCQQGTTCKPLPKTDRVHAACQ
jgi:hypothetical protein